MTGVFCLLKKNIIRILFLPELVQNKVCNEKLSDLRAIPIAALRIRNHFYYEILLLTTNLNCLKYNSLSSPRSQRKI